MGKKYNKGKKTIFEYPVQNALFQLFSLLK